MTNKKNIYAQSLLHTCSTSAILLMLACCMACSGSDPVEPNTTPEPEKQTAISFCGTMPEEQTVTRAGLEEVLTGDKTFQVWGYKNDAYEAPDYTSYQTVMPNFTVNWVANSAYTTTSNTNDWEYVAQGSTPAQQAEQTIKYWDFGANAYRFFGYALGNATPAVHEDPSDPSSPIVSPATLPTEVSVPGGYPTGTSSAATAVTFSSAVNASSDATIDAAPYFSRLWFSDGNVVTYPDRQFGKPVQLQFVKPFARVRFMFTFAEGLTFGRNLLSRIKFHPTTPSDIIATAGTVKVTYPLKGDATTESWTTESTTGIEYFDIDYYEAPDPAVTPDNALPTTWPNTPQKWYYVLPAASQASYTMEVAVITEDVKTVIIPAEYMTWKAGYEYTYQFKITEGGGITLDIIQVGINGWSNQRTIPHELYNW